METNFTADKVKITGPNIDGGFKVTFEVGEHQAIEVAKLLAIPQGQEIKVGVRV